MAASGLYLSLSIGIARVLVGTFDVEVSLGRVAVAWGEPLFAAAALLLALLVSVYVAELLLSRLTEATPVPQQGTTTNGFANATDLDATEDSIHEITVEVRSTIDHMKAIVAPVISLVLALVVVHMGLPSTPAAGTSAGAGALMMSVIR